MLLYYTPGACSLASHIALREAGIAFELKKVNLAAKRLEDGGDYTQINSKGYVPALKLDRGEILTEGPAILQYVADQRPETGLAPPAGTLERYRLQEWLNFISSEIHKSFSPLFSPHTAAEWKSGATASLTRRLDWLDGRLGAQNYLLGEQFSVADAYLFTTLNWSSHVKLDLGRWPTLERFWKEVGSRPKVVEALRAEGLHH